mgnify:CR=1 FL=1
MCVPYLFVYLSLALPLCPSLCLCVSVSLSLYLCVCQSLYLSRYISIISLFLSLSLPLSLPPHPSPTFQEIFRPSVRCLFTEAFADIQCNWRSLGSIIDHWVDWGFALQPYAGPGHWWALPCFPFYPSPFSSFLARVNRQDNVLVLGATHQYKRKYVTTVLYKPLSTVVAGTS